MNGLCDECRQDDAVAECGFCNDGRGLCGVCLRDHECKGRIGAASEELLAALTCEIHGTPLNGNGDCFPCSVAASQIPEPYAGYKEHAEAVTAMHELSGWLLEKGPSDNPVYLTCEQFMFSWESDLQKALRLARRKDAEALSTIVEDAEHIREVRLLIEREDEKK